MHAVRNEGTSLSRKSRGARGHHVSLPPPKRHASPLPRLEAPLAAVAHGSCACLAVSRPQSVGKGEG